MVSTLFAIWLLHVGALLTPGANVLLVSQLAASGDKRGASYAAVGIAIGAAIWSCAGVIGLGAILTAIPALRRFMQVLGAGYLLYFALRLWRSRTYAMSEPRSLTATKAVQTGMLTSLSNPKPALFYAGVFSVALPPAASPTLVAAALAIVVANALSWHLLLASLFSLERVQETYAENSGTLSCLSAVVVGVLGLSLLVSSL